MLYYKHLCYFYKSKEIINILNNFIKPILFFINLKYNKKANNDIIINIVI
jgi:hypothetical protein